MGCGEGATVSEHVGPPKRESSQATRRERERGPPSRLGARPQSMACARARRPLLRSPSITTGPRLQGSGLWEGGGRARRSTDGGKGRGCASKQAATTPEATGARAWTCWHGPGGRVPCCGRRAAGIGQTEADTIILDGFAAAAGPGSMGLASGLDRIGRQHTALHHRHRRRRGSTAAARLVPIPHPTPPTYPPNPPTPHGQVPRTKDHDALVAAALPGLCGQGGDAPGLPRVRRRRRVRAVCWIDVYVCRWEGEGGGPCRGVYWWPWCGGLGSSWGGLLGVECWGGWIRLYALQSKHVYINYTSSNTASPHARHISHHAHTRNRVVFFGLGLKINMGITGACTRREALLAPPTDPAPSIEIPSPPSLTPTTRPHTTNQNQNRRGPRRVGLLQGLRGQEGRSRPWPPLKPPPSEPRPHGKDARELWAGWVGGVQCSAVAIFGI